MLATFKRTAERMLLSSKIAPRRIFESHVVYERLRSVAEILLLSTYYLRARRVDAIAPLLVYDDDALFHLVDDALKFCRSRALGSESGGRKFFCAHAL